MLLFLHKVLEHAWYLLGELNAVLNDVDRIVGNTAEIHEVMASGVTFNICKLMDLQFSGCFHTWSNKHENDERIYSKKK